MGELVSIVAGRIAPNRQARPLEPLWRDVLGRTLRELRHEQGERLVETAARAGISPQYLSEVERGRKDPSSEMLAAIAGALGTDLVDLTRRVADELGGRRLRVVDLTPRAAPDVERQYELPASSGSTGQPQLLALAA
jgi:transcriptional regulator with XRE-family HTH domain